MGPIEAFITAWRKSFSYGGKATRSEYWWFSAMNLVAVLAIQGLTVAVAPQAGASLAAIYWFSQVFPSLSIIVRRLRDTGKGWNWMFISFVPFIGGIWLIYLMCQRSGRYELGYWKANGSPLG